MNGKYFPMIGWLLLFAVLGGCGATGGKNGGGSSVTPAHSKFEQSCNDFCQHAQALQCPEGTPLADGTSCAKFCVDTEEAGHDLNTTCRIAAKNCAELANCP
jgi:hypothetical protein